MALVTAWIAAADARACRPTAILSGSHPEVDSIAELLRSHGVVVGPPACPGQTVEATIDSRGGGIRLLLRVGDSFDRVSERRAADARTAASLIESWTFREDADVLAPRLPGPPPARPAEVVTAAVRPESPGRAWRMLGSLELSTGSDGSLWTGAAVTGCGAIRAACLGGRARLAEDWGMSGPTNDGGITRSAAELLVIAGLPLPRGRVTIMPLIGVGAGWMRTAQAVSPSEGPGSRRDFGLRAQASVIAAWSVARHWSGIGELGAGLGRLPPTRTEAADATGLPGPPAGYLWAAVGCELTP